MAGEISQRQLLVKVTNIDGYFSNFSGGNVTAEVGRVWHGGDPVPGLLASPKMPEDITVSRPFIPTRDAEIKRRLEQMVGRFRATVSVQPCDADYSPIGPPTVYPEALLSAVSQYEADAASGDPARWELVFATQTTA